jgi:hypothetical protein
MSQKHQATQSTTTVTTTVGGKTVTSTSTQDYVESSGRKRALLIGINYYGSPYELKGNIYSMHVIYDEIFKRLFVCSWRIQKLIACNFSYLEILFFSGCINDVANIKEFVQEHGFHASNIRVLTDDQLDTTKLPTRNNMLEGFKWLVDGAQPGDS